jgi:hypothetical protein
MPILTCAWAEDQDNATMARAAPTIKTVLVFMANSPQMAFVTLTTFRQGIGSYRRLESR